MLWLWYSAELEQEELPEVQGEHFQQLGLVVKNILFGDSATTRTVLE